MLGVPGIGTGATFRTAGMVGTAVVCGCGVADIVDPTGEGCAGCAGLVGAGCGTETQGLAGACGMAVVVPGIVSVGLALHSHRCHLM